MDINTIKKETDFFKIVNREQKTQINVVVQPQMECYEAGLDENLPYIS